jgi:cyclophilin family peptidyl-prolyl cis-trans isomerase
MARAAKWWRPALSTLVVATLATGAASTGCSNKEPAGPEPTKYDPAAYETPAKGDQPPPPNDDQHRPFLKVIRTGDEPPDGILPPADTTVTGKAIGKLYTEVEHAWPSIRFVNPQGRRIDYTATIETDLGKITIALRPGIAPNHVRNFIALARLGYYDGLSFERLRDEQPEDGSGPGLQTLEAGCPLGTGDPRTGHLGYWLRDEFPKPEAKVTHEAGTVGACHGGEADTACCRFYITLGPAPFLDGNYTVFGKITDGLDVAQKIFNRPSVITDQDEDGSRRPQTPVLMRKVTIEEHPQGGSTGAGG